MFLVTHEGSRELCHCVRDFSTSWWIQTQYLLCCETAVLTTVPPEVSQPFKKYQLKLQPGTNTSFFFWFGRHQFFFILTPSSLFSSYTETTHHSHLVSTTSPGIAPSVHPVPSQLTMMSISKVPLPFFPYKQDYVDLFQKMTIND